MSNTSVLEAIHILVDADACPVKDEIYKVAFRHQIQTEIVANSWLRIPRHNLLAMRVVDDGFDAADDYIANLTGPRTVVVTADILLADRCLTSGAIVISPTGKPFTSDSIGSAIATRAIMNDLRGSGDQVGGGMPPFNKADRSRFLSALDEAITKLKRSEK